MELPAHLQEMARKADERGIKFTKKEFIITEITSDEIFNSEKND